MSKKPSRTVARTAAPSPAERTAWFTDARFGMFIHWGIYAVPARGEWVRNREKISNEAYQPYFDEFNPVRCDPRRWAQLARRAGMKYAVMTAKHHDGFCLFDSALTDYKAPNTPARRDLIREYVDAFRNEGLKVGFYYSLLDWHHPGYPVDRLHPMRDDEKVRAEKRDFRSYLGYLHGQVRELLSNYGRIDVLWLDFSYDRMSGEKWRASKLVDMARTLQPGILIDNRLIAGHANASKGAALGDFATPEQVIPPEGVTGADGKPAVWESCITINGHWGYARDDKNFKSSAQLARMLVECVSKGGNLLLNVGPTALGEIQPEFVERLESLGCWMDYAAESIYGCGRAELQKPQWGYYTQRGSTLYAHILQKPVGTVPLLGLGGRVKKARLLRDGSEVGLAQPWMVGDNAKDAFLTLPNEVLPDPLDTVVRLDLA